MFLAVPWEIGDEGITPNGLEKANAIKCETHSEHNQPDDPSAGQNWVVESFLVFDGYTRLVRLTRVGRTLLGSLSEGRGNAQEAVEPSERTPTDE